MQLAGVSAIAVVAAGIGFFTFSEGGEHIPLPAANLPTEGAMGTYDYAALQRGYQVYKEVCSACHSMNLLAYRDLGGGDGFKGVEEGHDAPGIGFSDAQVKALAAEYKVQDGPNDQGEMFERPARPSDYFVKPFANEQAARVANNGALPPDLTNIIKARHGGADYVHALLVGYDDPPPADLKINEGLYYNKYFPGNQIAMPKMLSDDSVTYADGVKATADQEARDVASFLEWASEPYLQKRKRLGVEIGLFLVVLTGMLYAVKRRVWRDVH